MKKALLVTESSVYTDRNGRLVACGGGEMCFHNIAKGLRSLGMEVTVFAIREFADQKADEEIDGVVYKRYPVYSRVSFGLWKYLRGAVKKSREYDAVFLNQFTPHLILPFLKKCKRIAVIHDVYQGEGRFFWIKQYGVIKGFIGDLIEKSQLYFDKKYADKIMTVSVNSKEKIEARMGGPRFRGDDGRGDDGKIVVNPFSVDADEFNFDARKEDVALFVGRFVGYKNPEHVLFVLKKLKEKRPDFRAVFVVSRFEEWVLKNFKKAQRDLGLSDEDVVLKYDCSSDEVRRIFGSAKVFVQPSFLEGQGIVVLEALASRVPVVAYDLAAYKGMLRDRENCVLVKKGDKEGLAEGCIKILDNYERYKENCHEILGEFTDEKFIGRLKELIK